jgi:hypothetical protein
MRKLMAIVALLCCAANASSAKTYPPNAMCSGWGADEIVMTDTTKVKVLTSAAGIEVWERGTSMGTGLNGHMFSRDGVIELELSAEIVMDVNITPNDIRPVTIFKSRVFYPCGAIY